MYKVKFNTEKFDDRRYRENWEDQLKNDFVVAINGKEYICNTEKDLEKRFEIISGNLISKDENDSFIIKAKKYGEQRVRCSMYGSARGHVSFDETLDKIRLNGKIKIPFSDFYDLIDGKFFEGCFIEIEKIE